MFFFVSCFILTEISSSTEHDINVALNKTSYICNHNPEDKLTDGNREDEIVVQSANCLPDQNSFIKIELNAPHYINSVVVFISNVTEKGSQHPLDNFSVELRNPRTELCGSYPKSVHMMNSLDKGLRINCYEVDAAFEDVLIYFIIGDDFNLTEVEIFSSGLEDNSPTNFIHRGCTQNFISSRNFTFSNLSTCRMNCLSSKMTLMAISKPEEECLCGHNYSTNRELKLSRCGVHCEDRKRCGGKGVYSIYLLSYRLPHYKGCALGMKPPGVSFTSDVITINRCLSMCHDTSFVWLKDYTCSCFDKKLFYGGNMECFVECPGDPTTICGGYDMASVYTTCKIQSSNYLPCNELLRCKHGWFDEYGVCMKGCKDGFVGQHCLERVSDTLIPDVDLPLPAEPSIKIVVSDDAWFRLAPNIIIISCLTISLFY